MSTMAIKEVEYDRHIYEDFINDLVVKSYNNAYLLAVASADLHEPSCEWGFQHPRYT
jgi:hypothetical protein